MRSHAVPSGGLRYLRQDRGDRWQYSWRIPPRFALRFGGKHVFRRALPGKPGEAAFMAAYSAAHSLREDCISAPEAPTRPAGRLTQRQLGGLAAAPYQNLLSLVTDAKGVVPHLAQREPTGSLCCA